MFLPGSRYAGQETYQVRMRDGTTVMATRLPLPAARPLLGFHRRLEGQRLDLIAAHYLDDPTAFHVLCDANRTIVPDALAARELVGIPVKER